MQHSIENNGHTTLQRLIIVFLGLLTAAVIFQSCTSHKSCAAYNQVEVEQPISD